MGLIDDERVKAASDLRVASLGQATRDLNKPKGEGWHRADWMQTFTGRKFYPMEPTAEDIDPLDIAHSLSLLCRYNGHVTKFYSVAEHCILMSRSVPEDDALWALLHDATEAYVGDMVRPLKINLPAYKAIEDTIMNRICERFELNSYYTPTSVHDADSRILLTERRALMAGDHPWFVDDLEPLDVTIHAWSPEFAEKRYLARLKELGVKL